MFNYFDNLYHLFKLVTNILAVSKTKSTILIIIFFFLGVLVDRAVLYYEIGEKNKILLKEQESIKEEYKLLIKRFELVEQELLQRKLQDSLQFLDSLYLVDSTLIVDSNL